MVGPFDRSCAGDDEVVKNGRRRFDMILWNVDLPVEFSGVGIEANQMARGIEMKAFADDEIFSISCQDG